MRTSSICRPSLRLLNSIHSRSRITLQAVCPFQPRIRQRGLRVAAPFPSKMSGSPPYHNLTYYTFGTPNGLKPAIVLEELGLQYKVETVDISKNTQKEDWYLAINPNGRIPALKDGSLRVFETCAIMLYLTDHYDPDNKISYPYATPEYYEMMSWIMWQQGGLGPMQVSPYCTSPTVWVAE